MDLLEVVDEKNKPLAVLPSQKVHEQKLVHRSVIILFYDKEYKLYLQQRSLSRNFFAGYWDLSASGHVLMGESRDEAAHRQLKSALGISMSRLKFLHEMPASKKTHYEFISVYSSGPCPQTPSPDPEKVNLGLFVEYHELEYLIQNFTYRITPGLIYCWQYGCLFPFKY